MDENTIKRQNLQSLAEYRDDLRKHPRLTFLFIELTDSCNMRCLHCGSNCLPQKRQYVDVKKVISVLESVKKRYGSSSVMICLTGGEPLLHPGFRELAVAINELGFPWGMTSNGSLIDNKMARFLKETDMASITLSLDGTRETQNSFRGVPYAYDAVWQAVDCLHSVDIPVQLTTVVSKMNIGELDDIYRLLKEKRISSWRIINMEPIGRALDHPELLLDTEDHKFLLDYIREKRFDPDETMEVTYGCSHYLPLEYEMMVRDNYFICGSGIYVASILCNGDIFSCLDILRDDRLVQGNIAEDDFCNVWENRFEIFRKDRTLDSETCSVCPERHLCGGDSTHTWDFEHNEPMLCLYGKLIK